MFNTLFTVTVVCLSMTGQAAEISKWVDENGKTHYGAQPPSGMATTKIKKPRPVDPPPTQAEPQVVLYSTSWCGYCKKARAYLDRNNIAYIEKDIEKDRAAKRDYDAMGGRGIPFLVRGSKEIRRGFSVSSYDRFFAQR